MNLSAIYTATVLFAVSFVLTLLFSRWLIPALRRRRAGQPILEIGPSWHLSKAGTPTMGGLAFIAAILSVAIGWSLYLLFGEAEEDPRGLGLVLLYALLCALIGFADDFCKLAKRKNQGLTAPQKYLLQLLASALFLFLAVVIFGVDTAIKVPFSHTVWQLNGFYYPLALLYLTGMVNALNLTDGVDGLLSSTTAVIALFFLAWGYDSNDDRCGDGGAAAWWSPGLFLLQSPSRQGLYGRYGLTFPRRRGFRRGDLDRASVADPAGWRRFCHRGAFCDLAGDLFQAFSWQKAVPDGAPAPSF